MWDGTGAVWFGGITSLQVWKQIFTLSPTRVTTKMFTNESSGEQGNERERERERENKTTVYVRYDTI